MRLVFLVLLLAGCSSPSLMFMNVDPIRAEVEGSIFDVYSYGGDVQAIRVNMVALPSKKLGIVRGILAIEQATGCTVVPTSVDGDPALIQARINC